MTAPPFDPEAAWRPVRDASDPAAQRQALIDFLQANTHAGAPALQVRVKHRQNGAPAPIDAALWAHPHQPV